MEPNKLSISVHDLIDHGLLLAPANVRGEHLGKTIEATIMADGNFLWRGEVFNSPSVAAGRAITAMTGAITHKRSYFSVNGWKFWYVQCEDGAFRSLAEIRNSLPG